MKTYLHVVESLPSEKRHMRKIENNIVNEKLTRFRQLLDIVSDMVNESSPTQKAELLKNLAEARQCLVNAIQK